MGISAPSSYSIPLTRYAPASRQPDRYVARLSTFNFSTIHSSCQFPSLQCTPGDPMSPPPFVLIRVPRAPSHLRRPLRVPSFAPTLLPEPEPSPPTLFDSPLQFLFSSALGPGASPNSRWSPVPKPASFHSTHPPHSAAQVVLVICTILCEPMGRRFFSRSDPS